MKNTKPQLAPLYLGDQFKVLAVTGNAGADMPLHYCTSEAVVNVQQGSAILTMDDKRKEISPGMAVLIPANKAHTLSVTASFKAFVVMSKDATIKFAEQEINS
jgi:quercetin dioxygenase-like cupin family protein